MPVASEFLPHRLELVVDFVNTRDIESNSDELNSPEALHGWLERRGRLQKAVRVAHVDLDAAIGMRESLRAILLTHNTTTAAPTDALAVLDALASRGQLSACFTPGTALVTLAARTDGIDGALAGLLAPVALATFDGTWSRVKACAAEDCRWAFYDHSRNRSGRWCDMAECGNRTKVRSYRQRTRPRQ